MKITLRNIVPLALLTILLFGCSNNITSSKNTLDEIEIIEEEISNITIKENKFLWFFQSENYFVDTNVQSHILYNIDILNNDSDKSTLYIFDYADNKRARVLSLTPEDYQSLSKQFVREMSYNLSDPLNITIENYVKKKLSK